MFLGGEGSCGRLRIRQVNSVIEERKGNGIQFAWYLNLSVSTITCSIFDVQIWEAQECFYDRWTPHLRG